MECLRIDNILNKVSSAFMFRLILFVRQKVSKKLLIPEGDFCARGRRKTTVKAEANAQSPRFLSFAAITNRNQPSDKHLNSIICLWHNSMRSSFMRFHN